MSNIPIKDASDVTRKVDVIVRVDGPDTVETQAIAIVDPANGNPARPDASGNLPVTATVWGAQADAAASTDAGTFSLVALFKRLLQKLPGLGQAAMAASQSVVIASNQTPVPALLQAQPADFWPGYGAPEDSIAQPLTTDPDGALITRGSVLTDEGTFRVNFSNSSIASSIGTVNVAGAVVTGTGFSTDTTKDVHVGDYFKLDADGESAWTQIESIDSETQLTLRVAYTGGTSGAASRAIMRPVTGAGGSIAVASGACTLTSGTTANSNTYIVRNVDVPPLVYRGVLSISQRIANNDLIAGLSEPFTVLDRWYARFRFTGTNNTQVVCETSRNPTTTPSGNEIQSTTVTLPNGVTTALSNEYRVEVMTERVTFYINGVQVAQHTRVIPAQHDQMEASVRFINAATPPASSTSAVVDYVTGKNHNKLEVGVFSDNEQIVAQEPDMVPFSYSQAGVIAINTVLMVIDCLRYRELSLQCTAMGTTGTIIGEWSATGLSTDYVTATLQTPAGGTATTFTAAGLFKIPVFARYFRLRMSVATTAGTTSLTVNAYASSAGVVPSQTIQGSVTATGVAGTAAQGATASGNPVFTGGVAKTAQPAARTDGQMVAPLLSKVGHTIVMHGQIRDLNDTNAPVTLTTTTETTLVAAVAAVFNDLYSLTIANTSATGVRVDLRSVTAGAIVDSFWIPANTTLQFNPAVHYKQATVNTAWTVQLSAAVTDVRISARTVRNI